MWLVVNLEKAELSIEEERDEQALFRGIIRCFPLPAELAPDVIQRALPSAKRIINESFAVEIEGVVEYRLTLPGALACVALAEAIE